MITKSFKEQMISCFLYSMDDLFNLNGERGKLVYLCNQPLVCIDRDTLFLHGLANFWLVRVPFEIIGFIMQATALCHAQLGKR